MVDKIQIYADGADLASIRRLATDPRVSGFTTNPTLMKKAAIASYREFAACVLDAVGTKPVSFEVLADDLQEMKRQAMEIASWGRNVYVKIPVTNSDGELTGPIYDGLSLKGVKLNITAVMTLAQVRAITDYGLTPGSIISVFAGRVADTGRDPRSMMKFASDLAHQHGMRALWASAREVVNVVQAEEAGCDIITLAPDLIAKLDGFGRDLEAYSLETVRQFKKDAEGITL